MKSLIGRLSSSLLIFTVSALTTIASPTEPTPTIVTFKYQHLVGKEIDDCHHAAKGRHCHSHFQLDFTGSSISLDADIETDKSFQPISYVAKGQNSTRSYIDLNIAIEGLRATLNESGLTRWLSLTVKFFALQQDVPILTQELLLGYLHSHCRPERLLIV